MILLTLLAMQGLGGMSSWPPPEESLRFIFVRDDEKRDSEWKIRGSANTSTEWSGWTFLGIVDQCGGKTLTLGPTHGRRISVIGASGDGNLEIVRCVKASTSVRFSVSVMHRAYGDERDDKWPFKELWNR